MMNRVHVSQSESEDGVSTRLPRLPWPDSACDSGVLDGKLVLESIH